jgi:hypothetical protein
MYIWYTRLCMSSAYVEYRTCVSFSNIIMFARFCNFSAEVEDKSMQDQGGHVVDREFWS